MHTPPFSVIIPSHRRTDLLRECLASVFQYAPSGTEVIVVDDGSEHCSVSQTAHQFQGVRVMRNARPRGFCFSANAGIRAASAPVVELVNDDSVVTRDWAIGPLAEFENPLVAAVAPLVMQTGTREVESAGDSYDCGGFAAHCKARVGPSGEGSKWAVDSASGCGAFYRRDAFLALGGFPQSFRAYFEDVDLACRLRRAGFLIRHVPDSVIWHHGASTYGRPKGRLLEQQSCNEERLFWRNTSARPIEIARHIAVVGGKLLRRANEGQLTPWLCGRLRAWSMMFVRG